MALHYSVRQFDPVSSGFPAVANDHFVAGNSAASSSPTCHPPTTHSLLPDDEIIYLRANVYRYVSVNPSKFILKFEVSFNSIQLIHNNLFDKNAFMCKL